MEPGIIIAIVVSSSALLLSMGYPIASGIGYAIKHFQKSKCCNCIEMKSYESKTDLKKDVDKKE